MTPSFRLLHGDNLAILPTIPDRSIDALITDPPAGIGLGGIAWDSNRGGRDHWIDWLSRVFRECCRTMKPGAFALIWALPRTSHWTATAIEDSGLEVRDVVTHLQAQGYPKSRACLKPASEHWILARRRPAAPLADNCAEFGTGYLQIDACRTAVSDADRCARQSNDWTGATRSAGLFTSVAARPDASYHEGGRWPPNAVLSHAAACCDDGNDCTPGCSVAELGPAAKYFPTFVYAPKPKSAEKDRGLQGAQNLHPTVKGQALMRWHVRLVTPPGGTVLDPFAGSGSTGVACMSELRSFVGIEQDPGHFSTARARIEAARSAAC